MKHNPGQVWFKIVNIYERHVDLQCIILVLTSQPEYQVLIPVVSDRLNQSEISCFQMAKRQQYPFIIFLFPYHNRVDSIKQIKKSVMYVFKKARHILS